MMTRAAWAVRPETSRGRLYPEPDAPTRSPWQRDRDRIIHSSAFRKLQYKTQVFVNHEGDFYRTRLTHSIEVSQIARSVARELGLDEDLTEALALVLQVHSEPSHQRGWDERILRQLQFLDNFVRQDVPLNAVRGKGVITEHHRAVRHHKRSGDSGLDFFPDALVKIAVQRFVAATEVWPVVLRAEVGQRLYRRADALYFRNRL